MRLCLYISFGPICHFEPRIKCGINSARNVLVLSAYEFKIPRPFGRLTVMSVVEGLSPRNDIATQSLRDWAQSVIPATSSEAKSGPGCRKEINRMCILDSGSRPPLVDSSGMTCWRS